MKDVGAGKGGSLCRNSICPLAKFASVVTTHMRLMEPKKLASEAPQSAKCTENAKPQRVGMKASAYVVPGT